MLNGPLKGLDLNLLRVLIRHVGLAQLAANEVSHAAVQVRLRGRHQGRLLFRWCHVLGDARPSRLQLDVGSRESCCLSDFGDQESRIAVHDLHQSRGVGANPTPLMLPDTRPPGSKNLFHSPFLCLANQNVVQSHPKGLKWRHFRPWLHQA